MIVIIIIGRGSKRGRKSGGMCVYVCVIIGSSNTAAEQQQI